MVQRPRHLAWFGVLLVCGPVLAQSPDGDRSPGVAVAIDGEGPTAQVPHSDPSVTAAAMQRSGGSLLRATASIQSEREDPAHPRVASYSYFAVPEPVPKSIKKNDQVTVIVREESEASAKATTDLKKNADFTAQLTQFLRLRPSNFQLEGRTPATPIGASANGTRNFKGEATADRSDEMTFRVQAKVIDVKPNGTLVLSATKHVKWDDEDQYFTLSGSCRAEDLTPDNTILSTQLTDLDVVKQTKGAVRDTSKRGFIPKILDQINPF